MLKIMIRLPKSHGILFPSVSMSPEQQPSSSFCPERSERVKPLMLQAGPEKTSCKQGKYNSIYRGYNPDITPCIYLKRLYIFIWVITPFITG